jgi:catechol 2,3-dioxygenase-like lactoylglutathione lyase family enzyme
LSRSRAFEEHWLIAGGHIRSPPSVIQTTTKNAGGTAMLEKIVYTTVFVNDQDRALDFYTNVLGFEKGADNPTPFGKRGENPAPDGTRFLTVGVKGQDFQLVLWPGTPGQARSVQGRIPAAYTIETRDIREAFEALKSRGLKFETEVLEYPWGYVAVFLDPDGNRLQLRQGR